MMAKKLKIHSKDKLVHDVIRKFDERSAAGYAKYGSTLRDDNDTLYRWVNDVQEELMDAILYLQKVKETTRELVEEMYLQDLHEPVSLETTLDTADGFPEGCDQIGHPLCSTDLCPCFENEVDDWPPKSLTAYPGYTSTITKASGDVWITYDQKK